MSLQKDRPTQYYTHLAAKWSWRKLRYVPQGVKWIGPKEMDTLAQREKYFQFLKKSNPYLSRIRWYEPAYDEVVK